MGQTRVDLQHLLEDLRDAYPDAIEETILSEVVANALDSGATSVRVLTDPTEKTVVVVDDGCGMSRRELARYHDLAASTKTRGEGIGFAGVGIKLGLLVAEAVLTETRRGQVHVATPLAPRLAPQGALAVGRRRPAGWGSAAPPSASGSATRSRPSSTPATSRARCASTSSPCSTPPSTRSSPSAIRPASAFSVNGRVARARGADERRGRASRRSSCACRASASRRRSAILERVESRCPDDRQGLAVSTLGKVIRRGWDWIGLSSSSPALVGGLIEAPGLSAALTLNKGDFVRAGRRGITYLAYRKALQEAVQAQLAAWGEARDREDSARRRAARPLERDLEAVLLDLADDFPALAALVERRPGGQKRLPTGREALPEAAAASGPPPLPAANEPPPDLPAGGAPRVTEPPRQDAAPPAEAAAEATLPTLPPGAGGPRRPTRYGLAIDFEERPDSHDLGRLVESTVLVNAAHPAYLRAVASRSEGYHAALTVGMALAAVAVEPAGTQAFLTAFLARWGEAIGRDRRRRQPRRPTEG